MPTKRKKASGMTGKVTLSAKKKSSIAKSVGRAVAAATRKALSGLGGVTKRRKSTKKKK